MPARLRPAVSIPARAAVQYPVIIFVIAVTKPSVIAISATEISVAGSICSPKKKKKIAAKRSRSGANSRRDRFGNGTGNSDTDEKGANGGGHLQLLRKAGNEKYRAKGGQQYHLIGFMAGLAADRSAIAKSNEQDESDRRDRN
jgi:hypothetical protein